MMFVYLLTAVIVTCWAVKMIDRKSLIVNRTPLDIPIILFLLSQILSTIFSIDPHTSIFGYYSRSNGGLLSIISYILLYYAFVSNFKAEDVLKFLKASLIGGLLVSLYGIPEHFGVSPSCVILVQRFAADCWVQDVQARVFATMGQPNWLAAYLAMLIFPAIYFYLTAKTKLQSINYYLLTIIYYLAFTFTYSRGATLGLLGGLGTFIALYHGRAIVRLLSSRLRSNSNLKLYPSNEVRSLLFIISTFLLINFFFGSALTGDFRLIKQNAPPPRPEISLGGQTQGTQLETGGTESGKIRLIVWQGALEIFKHYPLLGSGVETFAYSYYNFRPVSHNLVSEWDFLYNKAHNEYLNYLATTGILGLGSYSIIIITFIIIILRKLKGNSLLLSALLASYISYLVQNFFLFSVVTIALFFYLFPALAFLSVEATKPIQLPKKLFTFHFSLPAGRHSLFTFIYRRPFYTLLIKLLPFLAALYLLSILGKFWIADTLFKNGSDYSEAGNPGRAYNLLTAATRLNGQEPLYLSELGFAAASASLALASDDAITSASLKDEAIKQTRQALKFSPKNTSILRTAIRTYYQLSALDPQFEEETIKTIDATIALAPTDAKLYYNKGLVLSQMGKNPEAIEALKKAVELKPDYRETYFTLGAIYKENDQIDEAIKQFEKVLEFSPNDEDALKQLEGLGKSL